MDALGSIHQHRQIVKEEEEKLIFKIKALENQHNEKFIDHCIKKIEHALNVYEVVFERNSPINERDSILSNAAKIIDRMRATYLKAKRKRVIKAVEREFAKISEDVEIKGESEWTAAVACASTKISVATPIITSSAPDEEILRKRFIANQIKSARAILSKELRCSIQEKSAKCLKMFEKITAEVHGQARRCRETSQRYSLTNLTETLPPSLFLNPSCSCDTVGGSYSSLSEKQEIELQTKIEKDLKTLSQIYQQNLKSCALLTLLSEGCL